MVNIREKHELEICEAILNLSGTPFKILGRPDKNIREKKAVDFNGILGNKKFYLEHTFIESYPHQIDDDKQIEFLFSLENELSGKLSYPGHYNLVLAPKTLKGHKDHKKIKKVLKDWVINNAKNLKLGSPENSPFHFLRETPVGLSFEVTLYRFPENDGKFNIIRYKPQQLELKRFQRIKTAIHKKCPKLKQSKINSNDLTILVLESNDIALANHIVIGSALDKVFSNLTKELIPDKVFLVMTDTNPWSIFLYKDNLFVLIS